MYVQFLLFMVYREIHLSCRFFVYCSWFVGSPTQHGGSVLIIHGLWGDPPILNVQFIVPSL